eukprot:5705532-Prymnesium_polylepis.1
MLSRRGIAVSFATARCASLGSTPVDDKPLASSLPRFLASSVHLVNTPALAPAFSSIPATLSSASAPRPRARVAPADGGPPGRPQCCSAQPGS